MSKWSQGLTLPSAGTPDLPHCTSPTSWTPRGNRQIGAGLGPNTSMSSQVEQTICLKGCFPSLPLPYYWAAPCWEHHLLYLFPQDGFHPSPGTHLWKGAEALTRDISFCWRTSLEWIWGFDTQKKRNKAANSICNDLFLSYNIARALPSTEANGEVGIMTDGISCPALKGFDSVNKWELGYLNLLLCKNNLALKINKINKEINKKLPKPNTWGIHHRKPKDSFGTGIKIHTHTTIFCCCHSAP